MGAGCYYTNEYRIFNKEKGYYENEKCRAVWLEIDPENEYDYQDELDNLFNDLKGILNTTYYFNPDKEIETKLYKISFKSTYNGDGIIIKQETHFNKYSDLDAEEIRRETLGNINFEKNYYSMINKLVKLGYKFRIATSSYTSEEYFK